MLISTEGKLRGQTEINNDFFGDEIPLQFVEWLLGVVSYNAAWVNAFIKILGVNML